MKLNFSKIKVLVIGDLMLDKYIIGYSTRMSPEAPVPVIIPHDEFSTPGGSANVAMNLKSLGANVYCAGIIGDDENGKRLLKIFKENNINYENIKVLKNFPTTTKTRIISNSVQIARIDNEVLIKNKFHLSQKNIEKFDIIILSDYNKGIFQFPWFQKPKKPITIMDPKQDVRNFKNVDIITPNLKELKMITGKKLKSEKSIINACSDLIIKYSLKYILAKLGAEGMILVGENGYSVKIKPHPVNIPDVTGAGDTVIASFSLAYFATKDVELSARISNLSASISINKQGTSSVSIKEIRNRISSI